MNNKTTVLVGVPASSGQATGTVSVIRSLPFDDFPEGGILVAHTTDPTYLDLLFRAGAVITEIGARLCHTAIVAMELGIPCIVGAKDACVILKDGDVVSVEVSSSLAVVRRLQ